MPQIIKLDNKMIMNDDRKAIGRTRKTVRIVGHPTVISARHLKYKSQESCYCIRLRRESLRTQYRSTLRHTSIPQYIFMPWCSIKLGCNSLGLEGGVFIYN
jgi:hypothetical protein